MISIKNAKKTYKMGGEEIKALDDVSFEVSEGEFIAIVGPSGSGKSTLLHTIGGLDSLDSGTVTVSGDDLASLKDKDLARYRNKTVGFIFQNFNLQSRYTALENVELSLIFGGIPKKERMNRAKDALEKVGLADRIDHKPPELSGGQQQRVSIARAMVNSPKIILADEPTGNLDSKSGEMIIDLLHDLQKNLKVTILVVTHDDRIAHKADRILRILDGKIVEDLSNGKKETVKEYTD
ncbi:MAG: ABC transporter ATP-binding protein [Candidatus Dojkabacteria bacterium]|jgi:putative ABC transport system ATP-binding protein|nr:ABC transporter ATP-binding protein [Candidatus Dojkabacteria bacterium]